MSSITTFDTFQRMLRIAADDTGGPRDQEVVSMRFIPCFKMFANIDRTLYFPHFFSWMGENRELSIAPILRRIGDLAASGKWGMVTNSASLEVLGERMGEDNVVEWRVWTADHLHGPVDSTMTLHFEWISLDRNGLPLERLALARMNTTAVEILDHGVVRPTSFPPDLAHYLRRTEPKSQGSEKPLQSVPEPFRALALGEELFRAKSGPRAQVFLAEKSFDTSLYESNLVGNIYFSNYAMWLAKLRDTYFFGLAPELFRGVGEQGALKCLRCDVGHLREAMPFDTISVSMSLKALYRHGADLYFEFFKQEPDGRKTKLAYADHRAVWVQRDQRNNAVAASLPTALRGALWQAAQRSDASPRLATA